MTDRRDGPRAKVNLGEFAEQRLKELEEQLKFLFDGVCQKAPIIDRKFLKDNMYLKFSFDNRSTERLCLNQWYKMPLKTGSCYLAILPQIARNIFVANCNIKFNGSDGDDVKDEIARVKHILLQYWSYNLFYVTSIGMGNNRGDFTARIRFTGLYETVKLEGNISFNDLLVRMAERGTEELVVV